MASERFEARFLGAESTASAEAESHDMPTRWLCVIRQRLAAWRGLREQRRGLESRKASSSSAILSQLQSETFQLTPACNRPYALTFATGTATHSLITTSSGSHQCHHASQLGGHRLLDQPGSAKGPPLPRPLPSHSPALPSAPQLPNSSPTAPWGALGSAPGSKRGANSPLPAGELSAPPAGEGGSPAPPPPSYPTPRRPIDPSKRAARPRPRAEFIQ